MLTREATSGEREPARHIAGTTTRLIVRHVRDRSGEHGVAELLALAGEARTSEELEDERTWSSYDATIALFEAAATLLDDPDVGRRIGEEAMRQRVFSPVVHLLRALGSPSQVCRNITRTSAKFQNIGTATALDTGADHARIAFALHEPFVRHRLHCDYMLGLLSQIPVLFALPPARVRHDECQAAGADRCVYRLTWSRHHRLPWRAARARVEHVEAQLAHLAEQVDDLQSTAADLVSADDVEVVLGRIAARAGSAVRAPGHLLAVRLDPDGPPSVHHEGLTESAAAELAAELLAGTPLREDDRRLVVDVASSHRRYGRLAAVYDDAGGFFPEEARLLAAYAGHAAAALDVADALAEARGREVTSAVLLKLARDLAVVTSPDEVCTRLAGAVPTVAGCDRATVFLWDAAATELRLVAHHGHPFPPGTEEFSIRPGDTDLLQTMLERPGPLLLEAEDCDDFLRSRLEEVGARATVVVPLLSRGRFLGVIAASWVADGPRGRLDHHLAERLSGVADQAATALENAHLVETVREQALHDPLTGLPNQVLFKDRAERALVAIRRTGGRVAMCFVDLDRFKRVNDTRGHAVGDQLLRVVAERLTETVRAGDTVARLSGDEFTVLLPDVDGADDAVVVAEKVLDALRVPFVIEGRELVVSPSIGIALAPDDATDADLLLRRADAAMYAAKQAGRNRWHLFATSPAGRAVASQEVQQELGRALAERQLTLLYQPQVELATGVVAAVEAVLRWHHPTLGVLGPDELLAAAEGSGLAVALDHVALRRGCEQVAAWRADGHDVRLAVKLSGQQFAQGRLGATVAEVLAESGLAGVGLEIEVAEWVVAQERAEVVRELDAVRRTGATIAIHRFGTSHPSVSRLSAFPVDTIKVDRSLLERVTDAESGSPAVSATVAMARELGLAVVAEGVAHAVQASFLRRIGCHRAQGPLFSDALPPVGVSALLSGRPVPLEAAG